VSGSRTTVHIFGKGFIGKAIADWLRTTSFYNVIEYGRNDLDLVLKNEKFLSISQNDSIVFSAAKAPCRDSVDLKYNLELIEGFITLVKRYNFSYLLNISSDAVYPDSRSLISEELGASPSSIHGIMHLTRELLLESAFPGKVGNVRPTLVYGANDPHNGYGPNRFVRNALMKIPITVFGLGEELRDHIYIKDLAEICEFMINNSYKSILNGVSGKVHSFDEIANLVAELIPGSKVVYVPRMGPMPHGGFRAFEPNQLNKLGLSGDSTTLKNGLVRMIEQERQLY